MVEEALQKNGIKINFVSKHFYQGLYCKVNTVSTTYALRAIFGLFLVGFYHSEKVLSENLVVSVRFDNRLFGFFFNPNNYLFSFLISFNVFYGS